MNWRLARRLGIVGAAIVVAAGTFLVGRVQATSATTVLTPVAMVTTAGHTGEEQKVKNLSTQDLTGAKDSWKRYVEFMGRYDGYLRFTAKDGFTATSVKGMQVTVNYRGPGTDTQVWRFQLKDWVTGGWVDIGSNAAAPDWGNWTALTFTATGAPGSYLSAGGEIQLRLVANNAADAADIDYVCIKLDKSPVDAPSPSASPVASPSPTKASPSPSASPTRSASPSPAPSTPAPTTSTPVPPAGMPAVVACAGCWHPALQTSWNWVISKVPTAPYRAVQMYDIDGFEASAATVTSMHQAGIEVVCYISVGSYEDWRPDAGDFPAALLGRNLDGWPGEKYLDIRDVQQADSALAKIMNARLDMCKSKGFDAVEFDNMDAYTNNTGFPLTAANEAYYAAFLANNAHQRGLSAVMKNDLDQISTLLPYFDMALNEQCNEYDECGSLAKFVQAGKPVFNAEYASSTSFCAADNAANINGVNFTLDLDDSKFQPCR